VDFLAELCTAQSFAEKALGLGKDIRVNGASVSGGALWASDRYVHICAFAQTGSAPERRDFWTRITRPSRRSRL